MKSKECMNCGSTKFHKVENGWKCDYCGTLYLTPKKKTEPQQNIPQPEPKKKRTRLLLAIVLASIFVLGLSLTYINYRFNVEDTTTYEPIKTGTANSSVKKDFPGGWTQDIYDSIKVATEHYDRNSETYSYTSGSSYEELEKLVGSPDSVTTWEKEEYGMPPRSMATWDKKKNGERAEISIQIRYDKENKMIIDKDRY